MENKLREARGEICEKVCLCDVRSDPTATDISTKGTRLVYGRDGKEGNTTFGKNRHYGYLTT